MDFKNRLKGKITQGLFEALLEDVNYRVVPLGIEEVVREIKCLSIERYLGLGLPGVFRKLPDFFVALPDLNSNWLVEVKFRRSWSEQTRDELGFKLFDQVSQWQPLYLVLFLGESARESNIPSNRLGVCQLVVEQGVLGIRRNARVNDDWDAQWEERFFPWNQIDWNQMSRFQDVFPAVSGRYQDETLIKAISTAESLGSLSNAIS